MVAGRVGGRSDYGVLLDVVKGGLGRWWVLVVVVSAVLVVSTAVAHNSRSVGLTEQGAEALHLLAASLSRQSDTGGAVTL